jgi:hypothetical protein
MADSLGFLSPAILDSVLSEMDAAPLVCGAELIRIMEVLRRSEFFRAVNLWARMAAESARSGQPSTSSPESQLVSLYLLGFLANTSRRGLASEVRKCSKGPPAVCLPTCTPRLRTICVSNGLVSIATRKPHVGQRKVTVSEP